MILIHKADLHPGNHAHGGIEEEEQREFIAFLTELARKRAMPQAVLIAGDGVRPGAAAPGSRYGSMTTWSRDWAKQRCTGVWHQQATVTARKAPLQAAAEGSGAVVVGQAGAPHREPYTLG